MSLPFVLNKIQNFLLYRHLCQIYLVGEKPLTIDFEKMKELPKGRCANWSIGTLIDPMPAEAKYQKCYLKVNPNSDRIH